MRTSNPALSGKAFQSFGDVQTSHGTMTIEGSVNKTGILLLLAVGGASWAWYNPAPGFLMLGLIGGLAAALITIFHKQTAGYSAPVYAVFEGLLLGTISAMYHARYPGIVSNAVMLTFGTLLSLLLAYRAKLIVVTEKFRMGVFAATGAIALVYLVSFIGSFFGLGLPFLHSAGPLGIGISLVIVVVAALNLVLDFDFIDKGASYGAPKYMEWYAGFGLMVTLIWLYLEILRLLALLRGRD